MTYPRAPARMTAMTSSAASDTLSARKTTSGQRGVHLFEHGAAAAVRHVHVEQHDVGRVRGDPDDRLADRPGLADDLDPVVVQPGQLGLDAGAEQRVVVDQEHLDRMAHDGPFVSACA